MTLPHQICKHSLNATTSSERHVRLGPQSPRNDSGSPSRASLSSTADQQYAWQRSKSPPQLIDRSLDTAMSSERCDHQGPLSPRTDPGSPRKAPLSHTADQQYARQRSKSPPPLHKSAQTPVSSGPTIQVDDLFFERLSTCMARVLSMLMDKPREMDQKILSELNNLSTSCQAEMNECDR